MPAVGVFGSAELEKLCKTLGFDTGSAIGQLLDQLAVEDVTPTDTKWRRLRAALDQRQKRDRAGNIVLAYVQAAMAPVRFVGRRQEFDALRNHLNVILSFEGVELGPDSKCRPVSATSTLSEAERRAQGLRHELTRRAVHHDVLRFCRAELLQDDYFHAVLEATKSLAEKLRVRSGLSTDGGALVDGSFGMAKGTPLLALNTLQTASEQDEQAGFGNLLKGLFGMFRNPTAHAPRIQWLTTEQDAIDAMTMLSFAHRRIDAAVATRTP